MAGVGLFLWMPSVDGEKERMLQRLQDTFQRLGVETFSLDLSSQEDFAVLETINDHMMSQPPGTKRFVFSFDGDGFGLTLRMEGLWVDNVQYNVFTYLRGHPREFAEELKGVNSWYISVLNSREDGAAYIEERYPHLDGAEYMEFPGCSDGAPAWEAFARGILERCK